MVRNGVPSVQHVQGNFPGISMSSTVLVMYSGYLIFTYMPRNMSVYCKLTCNVNLDDFRSFLFNG